MDSVAAMHVQANAIVHYGRSCFSKTNIPTYTVLPKTPLDITATLKLTKDYFNPDDGAQLCLFYDAEFEHCKGLLLAFLGYCRGSQFFWTRNHYRFYFLLRKPTLVTKTSPCMLYSLRMFYLSLGRTSEPLWTLRGTPGFSFLKKYFVVRARTTLTTHQTLQT